MRAQAGAGWPYAREAGKPPCASRWRPRWRHRCGPWRQVRAAEGIRAAHIIAAGGDLRNKNHIYDPTTPEGRIRMKNDYQTLFGEGLGDGIISGKCDPNMLSDFMHGGVLDDDDG